MSKPGGTYTAFRLVHTTFLPLFRLRTVITVRNLNNGRKVVCTNLNAVYVPPGFDIVLSLGAFTYIADLVDAPLPVELTW